MASILKLEPEDEAGVDRLVASGRYPSREAVVSEGLRLLRERDEWRAMVEEKVARGLDDIDAGRTHSIEEVRAYFQNRFSGDE